MVRLFWTQENQLDEIAEALVKWDVYKWVKYYQQQTRDYALYEIENY